MFMKLSLVLVFLLVFSVTPVMAEPCEGNFDCDFDVDGTDAGVFKEDFGRSSLKNPCSACGVCSGGTLSPFGRWCDRGDGTVKDMTTGLMWLKKADWGGSYRLVNEIGLPNAHYRATSLWDGSPDEGTAGLSDGSIEGEWRLPTFSELVGITVGSEHITTSQMYFFTGVQTYYWSTSFTGYQSAWAVSLATGQTYHNTAAAAEESVWPVRSDN